MTIIVSGRIKSGERALNMNFDNTNTQFNSTTIPNVLTEMSDQMVATQEPTGMENQTDSILSFDDSTRTFTITPISDNFRLFFCGHSYTKTSSESVTIDDTEGMCFIYYEDDGTLSHVHNPNETEIFEIITGKVFVAVLYWDSSNNTAIYFADERHGINMDSASHIHFHLSFGTQYISGLYLNNFNINGLGNDESYCQFSVENGYIKDEDLSVHIINGNPQQLSPIAQIPAFYIEGSNWRKKTANNYPVIDSTSNVFSGSNGLPAYNYNNNGSWELREVPNNYHFISHVFATNDIRHPIIFIPGNSVYETLDEVRNGVRTELNTITTSGLPFAEFVPIGSVIFKASSAYSNTPKAVIYKTADNENYNSWLRTLVDSGLTDHKDLTGLNNTDSHPDTSISTSGHTGVLNSNTNVNEALTTIDNLKHTDCVDVDNTNLTTSNIMAWESNLQLWKPAKIENGSIVFEGTAEIQSITYTDGTYSDSDIIDITVTYSETVTVDTTGGVPRLQLNVSGNTYHADYISGHDTNILTFRYTIGTEQDYNGISIISPLDYNNGLIVSKSSGVLASTSFENIDTRILLNVLDPRTLGGVVVWYDATDINTITMDNSNQVQTWADKSGNNLDGNQLVFLNQPIYIENGLDGTFPAIEFDGSNDYMVVGQSNLLDFRGTIDSFSYVAVHEVETGDSGALIAKGRTTATDRQWYFGVISDRAYHYVGDSNDTSASPVTNQVSYVVQNVDTTGVDYYINGVFNSRSTSIGNGTVDNVDTLIGARRGSTNNTTGFHFNGKVSEILLFDKKLSTSEISSLTSYLMGKYNI